MKRLHFEISNDLSKFLDELLIAIPSLGAQIKTIDGIDERHQVISVEGTTGNLWLTVPDDADEAAIQVVVDAHDPTP